MIDNIAVGKTIARMRQNKNMTQQQLAAALNVSHQAVSKWETGSALPDIQTLMNLTRLFGVTMEQLLNGEVPEDRMDPKPAPTLDESLQSLGNFVGNIVNGIFRPEKKEDAADGVIEPEEPDGAVDAQIEEEEEALEEAPEEATEEARDEDIDLKHLLQMAPFMSRAALDSMLLEHREALTAADIAKFAPFISRECLEKLIRNSETEITWETLQRVAPFLKREMVDALTRAAAKGRKVVKDAAEGNGVNTDEIGKSLEEVSQKLGEGMEKAAKKVAREVTNAYNTLAESCKSGKSRAETLRRAACERALQDGNWDWLAAHCDGLQDEDLMRQIAQKANALGMHDWVLEHLNGYADTRTIDAAIEAGNWGWLGDHAWQFEDSLQEKIALAAAAQENWQWLSIYSEQISLENCADRIAIAAYAAKAHVLARQLAERCMNQEQRQALANAAAVKGDYGFLRETAELLDAEYFGRLCLARAQEKDWDCVRDFIELSDRKSVEQMMELAIAEGNFDAVDLVDPYL